MWLAKYYNNFNINLDPDFPTQVPDLIQEEPEVNHGVGDVPPGIGSDYFAASFSAYIIPEFTEVYTLRLSGDDGIELYVDDVSVAGNWAVHDLEEVTYDLAMVAGVRRKIRVEWAEYEGNSQVYLKWESASQSLEIIPNERSEIDPQDDIEDFDSVLVDNPAIYYIFNDSEDNGSTPNYGFLKNVDPTGRIVYLPIDWNIPAVYDTASRVGFGGKRFFSARAWLTSSFNLFRIGKGDSVYGLARSPAFLTRFSEINPKAFVEWSVESWFYLENETKPRTLFTFVNANVQYDVFPGGTQFIRSLGIERYIALFVNAPAHGGIRLVFSQDNLGERYEKSIPFWKENEWVHFCITYKNGIAKVYINGLFVDSLDTAITLQEINPNFMGLAFPIGIEVAEEYSSYNYLIDNFAMFDYELSPAQVYSHYAPPQLANREILYDVLPFTDIVTVNVEYNRTFADTVTFSEHRGPKADLNDHLEFDDYFLSEATISATFTENFFFADYVNVLNVTSKEAMLTDFIDIQDNVDPEGFGNIVDRITITETLETPGLRFDSPVDRLIFRETVSILHNDGYVIHLNDQLYFTESLRAGTTTFRLIDNLILTDLLQETGLPERSTRTDTLVFTDKARANLHTITIRDTILLNDSVRQNIFKIEIIDPLAIQETLRYSPLVESLVDSFTIDDTVSFQTNHQVVQDDLEIDDFVQESYGVVNFSFEDTLSFTETLHYIPDPIRLTDELSLTDSMGHFQQFDFEDTLVIIDTMERSFAESFTDTLTITDSLGSAPSKSVVDTLTFLDGLCVCYIGNPTMQDTLVITDSVSVLINEETNPPVVGDGNGIIINAIYKKRLVDRLHFVEAVSVEQPPKACCLPPPDEEVPATLLSVTALENGFACVLTFDLPVVAAGLPDINDFKISIGGNDFVAIDFDYDGNTVTLAFADPIQDGTTYSFLNDEWLAMHYDLGVSNIPSSGPITIL